MSVLTVATRAGKLAIAQTQSICFALEKIHPDIQIKIKRVATRGDRDRRTALWNLKDTGFFTSQVEDTLLAGDAHFAVHSFKDLPTSQRKELLIAAVCDRKFPEDCLLTTNPISSIEELPEAARIGTSSLRRAAQIKHLRPDLQPTPIRGNVLTRIRRLAAWPKHNRRQEKLDAIILARAGIERLGLSHRISICFDPTQFIPAPAQGALAVQTRTEDSATNRLISTIDDPQARTITFAERKVLATMQCGCHAPVGAFARIEENMIEISAFISDLQGKNLIKRRLTGPMADAEKLAEQIANQLLTAGGSRILASLNE